MADNLLYLECPECRARTMLAKQLSGGLATKYSPGWTVVASSDSIQGFLAEHAGCDRALQYADHAVQTSLRLTVEGLEADHG